MVKASFKSSRFQVPLVDEVTDEGRSENVINQFHGGCYAGTAKTPAAVGKLSTAEVRGDEGVIMIRG